MNPRTGLDRRPDGQLRGARRALLERHAIGRRTPPLEAVAAETRPRRRTRSRSGSTPLQHEPVDADGLRMRRLTPEEVHQRVLDRRAGWLAWELGSGAPNTTNRIAAIARCARLRSRPRRGARAPRARREPDWHRRRRRAPRSTALRALDPLPTVAMSIAPVLGHAARSTTAIDITAIGAGARGLVARGWR